MAESNIKIILEIFFLTLSNMDIKFAEKKLVWKIYTIAEGLTGTRKVERINKKKFLKEVWNKDVDAFVVNVSSLSLKWMTVYPVQEGKIASLLTQEVIMST